MFCSGFPKCVVDEYFASPLNRIPIWVRWLVVLLPLRIALITIVPVLPEEAYHWNFARHLDWSYYDHPPMIAWSIAAGRVLFGDTALGIRVVPLLYSVGTSILLARMAKRFYGDAAAVWAIVLFTLMPVGLMVSAAGFPDSPLLFFWALTMSLAWKAIDGQDGRRWMAAGAALGAAMLSKYTAVLLVPGVFLHLVSSRRDRRWLATPWPYLAAVVALAVFAPVIYWNWKHEWSSFRFQTMGRMEEARGTAGRPGRFLVNQALANVPLTLPLLLAAAVRLVRTARREEQFLRSCLLPILSVFVLVSLFRPAHLLWPVPGYLGLIVVMAAIVPEGRGRVARLYGRARHALVAISIAGFLIAGVHLGFFLPWISPIQGPYGWEEAAARAREVWATIPDPAFYLALGRKYTCTSQLAYRLNLPEDVFGADLIGDHALQYEYWSDPAFLKGRSAVIVLEDHTRAYRLERLRQLFGTVEPAGEVVVPVGRSPLVPAPPVRFTLYRARGYQPPESLLSRRLDGGHDRRRD